MDLRRFHPPVSRWFEQRFGQPTAPQEPGWAAIAAGADTLVAAPTGSGKTLAAFLWAINGLVDAGASGRLTDETAVVYVSPLKALGNDIQKNLAEPLAGIRRLAAAEGTPLPEIRVAVRTGDTPAAERGRMVRRPPHILITTPESLYILLTAGRSRDFLRTARTVIVDEIHAVAGDKRGSHLALSLERLEALCAARPQRIGLSATQRPIEEIARLLVGAGRARSDGSPDCSIVDVGHIRPWDLSVEVPGQPLAAIATHEMWEEIYDRLAALARRHRTTLVFTHTRRLVERVAHHLTLRLGKGSVAAHHGSLARHIRLEAEQRLKAGTLPVVVASASLELGIDIGEIDLVCHLGAARSVASLLQRVGRSGHGLDSISRGIIFPLTRDELVAAAAAVRAARAGVLDRVTVPRKPLDILAQQIVAIAASNETREEDLWRLVRRAYPYMDLSRREFEQVVEILSEGISTARGRQGAYLHRDRVHGVLRGRRGARLAAITSGGAIPDTADLDVFAEPQGTFLGRVNEEFAQESLAGDTFLLGNASWRIRRIEAGRMRVEDAHGALPTIPFWKGEAPARTVELSEAVSDLRKQMAIRLGVGSGRQEAAEMLETGSGRQAAAERTEGESGRLAAAETLEVAPARQATGRLEATQRPEAVPGRQEAITWLVAEAGVDRAGAEQIAAYIAETAAALGCVPGRRTVVAERFFDEAGGTQVVLHAPLGSRITRAWGLALRRRLSEMLGAELQAAATDDGIVLSLGEQHGFPLESVFSFVRAETLEDDLLEAVLDSPVFTTRWRWNAARALAVLRNRGGRRVPMPIQRMRSDDLLEAVFPEHAARHEGGAALPDHPLVTETTRNCLHEALDLDGARAVLAAVERGEIKTVAVETPAPSPASHEILNANPYAFLDDAPLEERRARAVRLRRVDPDLARGIGALDPDAIAQVVAQAQPPARDADELYDLLLTVGVLPTEEATVWVPLVEDLLRAGRAIVAAWDDPAGRPRRAYVALERLGLAGAAFPDVAFDPEIAALPSEVAAGGPGESGPSPDEAVQRIVHGWMQCAGPVTAPALADRLGLPADSVERSLTALEGSGTVLSGRFTPSAADKEWCERGLLARIHRMTIGRLRREIEPVSVADFMRFLFRWQHVQPGTQLHGRDGLAQIVGQLQGLELPAPAWEEQVLPARVRPYDPADLEYLCLAGVLTWGRLNPAGSADQDQEGGVPASRARRRQRPVRNAPLAFLLRDDLPVLIDRPPSLEETLEGLSSAAADVARYLEAHGASFLGDIAKGARRLPSEVEDALWELVAHGLVSGDGVAGLRRLLRPGLASRRRHLTLRTRPHGGRWLMPGGPHGVYGTTHGRPLPTGRWSLWARPAEPPAREDRLEAWARQLLRRYGVVLRDLLLRERAAPPWRCLLETYRRLEARGEIRGGRFVDGPLGEQFALPEAVEALRAVRRSPEDTGLVVISAADPLNLVGTLLPGARISPFSGLAIAHRNGVPAESGPPGVLFSRLQRSPWMAEGAAGDIYREGSQ